MKILAILIAIAITHLLPSMHKYRHSHWFDSYVRIANKQFSIIPGWSGIVSLVTLPLLPLLLLWAVMSLSLNLLGAPGMFLLAIIILLYTIGPRDLDADVKAYLGAQTSEQKNTAMIHLCGAGCNTIASEHNKAHSASDQPEDPASMPGAVFQQALRRWFAIIFWFVLTGVFGAFAYRLIEWLSHRKLSLSEKQSQNFTVICNFMEWPVAQLMTLGLAIAADFDSVYTAWKQYHHKQGHSLFEGDNGFLRAAASCVIQSGSAANDGFADQLQNHPHAIVKQAMDLVWRVFGVWLAVLAILLLSGWLG